MKSIKIFSLLLVFISGCTFHYTEKSVPQKISYYDYLKERVNGKTLTVKMNNGSIIPNREISFSSESFSWKDSLGSSHSASIKDVRSFSYKSHFAGALLWGSSGVFAGGIAGMVLSAFRSEPTAGGPAYGPLEYTALGALTGGLIGTIIGLINGKEITYSLNSNEGYYFKDMQDINLTNANYPFTSTKISNCFYGISFSFQL